MTDIVMADSYVGVTAHQYNYTMQLFSVCIACVLSFFLTLLPFSATSTLVMGHLLSICRCQLTPTSTPLGSHVFISERCNLLQNIVSLSQTVAKCVCECQAVLFLLLQAL